MQIKLDLNDGEKSAELDDSNVLALPSKKRQSKVKLDGGQKTVKRLTRKERKRLQKIVEQKGQEIKGYINKLTVDTFGIICKQYDKSEVSISTPVCNIDHSYFQSQRHIKYTHIYLIITLTETSKDNHDTQSELTLSC